MKKKELIIVFVLTLFTLTLGIGIGVSYTFMGLYGLLEHINIQEINLHINHTKLVETAHELVKEDINEELNGFESTIHRMVSCFEILEINNINLSNKTAPWRVEWKDDCCYFIDDFSFEGDNTTIISTGKCFELPDPQEVKR